MLRFAVAASVLACMIGIVTAHGGGQHYIIDGVVYQGNWNTLNNTDGSIQRAWNWDGISNLGDPYMACGHDGSPNAKSYYAPILAGRTISVNYSLETIDEQLGRPWTFGHPYGPMLAYMAACPDEGCENVDLNAPIWFKTWEAGLLSGTWAKGYWAMRDVFEGANLEIPTPESLKPGKYLFRHEMINLQTGLVQWFPNCVQLEVSGSGSNLPSSEELVAFPGIYEKDLDKSFTLGGSQWFYVTHGSDTVGLPSFPKIFAAAY